MWAVAPRLGGGGGGSWPRVSESRLRYAEPGVRSTSTRDLRPRGERGQRVSSGGGWDGASGWWRARPGDPGAPLPSEPGRGAGVDPQSYQSLFELGGSWGFALGSKGGRNNSVAGTRAARAGEEGGHSPFPGPRPHCLSRLRPGPTPQHVLAAPI